MLPPPPPKPRRPRGRPPIHHSAGLNLVLPAQLFPQFASEGCQQGEKRLMLAVLQDAIDVVIKCSARTDARARQLFAETASWISSEDDVSFFSFLNVCDTLGLSASCLRRALSRFLR